MVKQRDYRTMAQRVDNPSASPLTGEKRPRVAGSSERTELVNDVVAVHNREV
jgi:hypothetical protein